MAAWKDIIAKGLLRTRGARVYCAVALSGALAAVGLLSCNDLDTDKISEKTSVSISPGLYLPLAEAHLTIERLFDAVSNAVEYYTSDGKRKMRLRAEHDALYRQSLFGILGLNKGGVSLDYVEIPLMQPLAEAYVEQQETGGGGLIVVPLDFKVDLSMLGEQSDTSVDVSNLKVIRAVCPVELEVVWTDFKRPVTLDVSLAGLTKSFVLRGSGSGSMVGEHAVLEAQDGAVTVGMTASATSQAVGQGGTLMARLTIGDMEELTCSLGGISLHTDGYFNVTGMESMRRMGSQLEWKDPRLWIECNDETPLDVTYTPNMEAVGGYDEEGNVSLQMGTQKALAHKVSVQEYNNENTNFTQLLNQVPDSIYFFSWLNIGMPSGVSQITVTPQDSIKVGYSYTVPFNFKLCAEMDPDTIDLHDVPDLEYAKRGRLFVTTVNSLPMSGSFSLVLYDHSEDKELNTVDLTEVFKMPDVDSKTGYSQGLRKTTKSVDLSSEVCADLGKCDALIFRVALDTENNFVTPTLDDALEINMSIGLDIDYLIETGQ